MTLPLNPAIWIDSPPLLCLTVWMVSFFKVDKPVSPWLLISRGSRLLFRRWNRVSFTFPEPFSPEHVDCTGRSWVGWCKAAVLLQACLFLWPGAQPLYGHSLLRRNLLLEAWPLLFALCPLILHITTGGYLLHRHMETLSYFPRGPLCSYKNPMRQRGGVQRGLSRSRAR